MDEGEDNTKKKERKRKEKDKTEGQTIIFFYQDNDNPLILQHERHEVLKIEQKTGFRHYLLKVDLANSFIGENRTSNRCLPILDPILAARWQKQLHSLIEEEQAHPRQLVHKGVNPLEWSAGNDLIVLCDNRLHSSSSSSSSWHVGGVVGETAAV